MMHKLESRLGRNINNFRYADDSTLMAESEEGIKSFMMKVKEESERACLKLSIQNEENPCSQKACEKVFNIIS